MAKANEIVKAIALDNSLLPNVADDVIMVVLERMADVDPLFRLRGDGGVFENLLSGEDG